MRLGDTLYVHKDIQIIHESCLSWFYSHANLSKKSFRSKETANSSELLQTDP